MPTRVRVSSAQIAPNIAVKVPLTWDGLKTCKVLSSEGKMVNVTLCFSAAQALLAAKAGAPATATRPPPPAVGAVVKGYRFLGGNPADPKSWARN